MSIHVAILPGLTPDAVKVSVTGVQDNPITAAIVKDAWGIDDIAPIAEAWAAAWGYTDVRVDDVVWDASQLDSPAQLNAAHGYANYQPNPIPLYVRLAGTGGRLLEIQEEVVLADKALWDNRGNPDVRHFEASMSVTTSNSVESSWERSQSLGVSAEIGTSIGPVDAKTSISYSDTWGESHGETHGQDVEFSNSIDGDLQPGELQVAALTQQRGFAKVETDYALGIAPYEYSEKAHRGQYIGFKGNVGFKTGFINQPTKTASEFVIKLVDLLHHAEKPLFVRNTRKDTIGVFADADLKSYPIPDTTEEAIEKAVGAHGIETTFPKTKTLDMYYDKISQFLNPGKRRVSG